MSQFDENDTAIGLLDIEPLVMAILSRLLTGNVSEKKAAIAAHPEGKGRCWMYKGHLGRHELRPEPGKPRGVQFDTEAR